jgi:ribosomal protein S6
MYELIVVGRADGDADSLFTRIEKMIKDGNASSVVSQKMGKKPLGYPIRKQTEAEYFLFSFDAAGDIVAAISQNLKLEQEDVLRYLIVKTKTSRKESRQPKGQVSMEEKAAEKTVKASKALGESVKVKEKKASKASGKTKTAKTKKK